MAHQRGSFSVEGAYASGAATAAAATLTRPPLNTDVAFAHLQDVRSLLRAGGLAAPNTPPWLLIHHPALSCCHGTPTRARNA